jgi:hypothetical protein
MADAFQAKRWRDFRRRADYAPESVYRHRTRGWEYIPVHSFGDEPAVLARLGLRPEDCRTADAWWGIDRDATLLESGVIGTLSGPARLFAKATPHDERWVYLVAVFDAPFVTRAAFEEAMIRFVEAGFPRGDMFQLRWGDRPVQLPDESAA